MKSLVTFSALLLLFVIANCQRQVVKRASCNFDGGSVCYYTLASQGYIHNPPWTMVDSSSRPEGAVLGPSNRFFKSTTALALLSPKDLPLNGLHCLTLDYQFGVGNLDIIAKGPREAALTLFSRKQDKPFNERWQHHQRNLDFKDALYQITIGVGAAVSADNLMLSTGECEVQGPIERFCDFDSINGGRRQLAGDANYFGCDWLTTIGDQNVVWKLVAVSNGDHSTGSRYGGALQVTKQSIRYMKPQLVFSMSPEDGAHCFEFWTFGDQVWTISEMAVNTNITNVLLEYRGSDRRAWQQQMVTIDPVVEIQVRLEITSESTFQIDSVHLKKGKCPAQAYCDFTRHLCGYSTTSPYNVGTGNLVFSQFDPLPSNRSFYMDLSEQQYRPKVAELTSANIFSSGNMCFKVRYSSGMFADIDIFTLVERQKDKMQSQTDGDDIEKTIFADIYFKIPTNFKILIQITGHGDTKMVPIHEASLHVGTCQVLRNPIPPQPIRLDYLCQQSGHYIPRYRTCDGVIDCPMGEDEGEHCLDTNCSQGGIPCTKRGHRFCLTDTTQFCDGESDCDDGIDEDLRMCDEQSFCDNFCLNSGQCLFNSFSCNCNAPGLGKRCN